MRCIDLETFYSRAITTLEIASSYIGNKSLTKLIISCRLKPIIVFDGTFRDGRLETHWVDEFGNSLYLIDNKIKIVLKDLSIKANTQISTDLFYSRSILGALQISKAVALVGDHLAFYGQDEYFRCFDIRDGSKISPLEVDVNELIDIQRNANGSYKLPNDGIETIMKKEYSRYE